MIKFILEEDEGEVLEFADVYNRDQSRTDFDMSMLFSKWLGYKGGKVEIILVPYVDGSHMCTSMVQVLSLLFFVQDMQNDGILHGDFRGRNIVFMNNFVEDESNFLHWTGSGPAPWHAKKLETSSTNGEEGAAAETKQGADKNHFSIGSVAVIDPGEYPSIVDISQDSRNEADTDAQDEAILEQERKDMKTARDTHIEIVRDKFKYACLIDFDFGGHVHDHPKYPRGYQAILDDGKRKKVEGGQKILKEHDLFAMTSVLKLHELTDSSRSKVLSLWQSLVRESDLTKQIEAATQLLRIFPVKAILPTSDYKGDLELTNRVTSDRDPGETESVASKELPTDCFQEGPLLEQIIAGELRAGEQGLTNQKILIKS
jgi:hypothetical protein